MSEEVLLNNIIKGEQELFAKYYGVEDLVDNDEFWKDVLIHLKDTNAILPMEHNPENVRVLSEMLDCHGGDCGECCRYGITPIYPIDIKRILDSGKKTLDELQNCIYTRKDGSTYMRGEPVGADCPLMKDNVCTIYEARPNACWLFPVQMGGVIVNNVKQISYRIKCKSSVDVIRKIIGAAIHKEDKILLPNLKIINKGGKKDGTD